MKRDTLFSCSGRRTEEPFRDGDYGAALVRERFLGPEGTVEHRLVVLVSSDGGQDAYERRESHRFLAEDAEALEAFAGSLAAMARALRESRAR